MRETVKEEEPGMAKDMDPRPARARGAGGDARVKSSGADDAGLGGALRALELGLEKKALEPVLLDVRGLCTYCNYQLVLSGRSDRQVDAISEAIVVGLKKDGVRAIGTEGKRSGQWALLDFGDFVVHVFHHPQREHFDLEGLWVDAPRVEIDVPADARVQADEY